MLQDDDVMNCNPTQAYVSHTTSQNFIEALMGRLNPIIIKIHNIITKPTKNS